MGKSTLAQALCVVQGERRFYIATMRPRDAEDEARIARHRMERSGQGFETVECPERIGSLVGRLPKDASLLLDSTTALLAEEMFGADGTLDENAPARVEAELLSLMDAYEHVVVVSDAIYSDGGRYDEATERYRKGLARIDRTLAARCDAVLEMAFGQRILHKGDGAVAAWMEASVECLFDGAGAVHGAAGGKPLA